MVEFSAVMAGAEILRDTMLSIPAITTLVPLADDVTQFKIFFEHVPDYINMPYFVIQHIVGGHENDTQANAVDVSFKAVIVTADIQFAVSGHKALSKLHRLDPVMTAYATGNPDSNPVLRQYSSIREVVPVFDRLTVHNRPLFQGGSIFRLRFIQE